MWDYFNVLEQLFILDTKDLVYGFYLVQFENADGQLYTSLQVKAY